MASSSKHKKVKGVRQKLKLFRASEPLKSVLMWGVNYSFNQLNHVKTRAMLLSDDFKAYLKVKVNNHLFNKENMPSRFKFKEYCPLVFQNLRERFSVDPTDFWDSFTKHQPIWDIAKGRSGAKFLLSYNKHYIAKTISSEEVEQMHHMLQDYHEYIVNNFAKTRLPQYLAMYRLTVNDQETYVLIMRYVFSPRLQVHRKYDLKGSTVDREATEKEKKTALPTLKDLDFTNDHCKILIGQEEKAKLLEVLERDVAFLQGLHLMDYSLIVGIHDLDTGNVEAGDSTKDPEHHVPIINNQLSINETSPAEEEEDTTSPEINPEGHPSPPDSPKRIKAPLSPYSGELHSLYEYYGVKSAGGGSGKQVIYFLSIIDILTHYGMRKRTAQKYKSVKHGAGAEISTVKPEMYGRRFMDFLNLCIE